MSILEKTMKAPGADGINIEPDMKARELQNQKTVSKVLDWLKNMPKLPVLISALAST